MIPPMIKVVHEGIEYFASNPVEAAALGRALREQGIPKVGRPRIERLINGEDTTLAFMNALASAGPSGAEAADLMKALKVDNAKGIGGRSVKINNALLKLGFQPDHVYHNPRTADGNRYWKKGPKFDAAFEAIKQHG